METMDVTTSDNLVVDCPGVVHAGAFTYSMLVERLSAYGQVLREGNHVKVAIPSLCRNDRLRVLNAIFKDFHDCAPVMLTDRPDYSSIGYVKIANFKICVKSLRQQSKLAPGLPNEQFLTQKINKYLLACGRINLIFFNGDTQVRYDDVGRCYATENRKRRRGRNKADMIIETQKSEYCVSIKQSDAERWESADTSHGKIALQKLENAIRDGKTSLVNVMDVNGNPMLRSGDANRPVMRVEPELYWKMDPQEQRKIIFGDDVINDGAVAIKTFDDGDFQFDESSATLRVSCERLYVPSLPIRAEDEPCWMIRNDVTRNCRSLGILGLRIESVFLTRTKYAIEVD